MSAANITATFLTTMLPDFVANVRPAFSWYDYILFSGMLTVSALIGVYFGCFGSKQATTDEYLMGSKRMKVFPISMSLIASHISGITLLAVPADVYRFGASYLMIIPGVFIVATITIYVYLPVFFKLRITSTYEYLERRFDNKNRMLASALFSISLFLYLPIVIYIPALAFSAATGINVHLVTPIVCGVCIFYTTIGGLKAVVWTDTLQFTITVGAVLTVFYLGVKSVGGFGTIWTNALEGERLSFFNLDPDFTTRDSLWILIAFTFHWIGAASIHQSCVQKFLSVSTLREANLSVIFFAIGICVISGFSIFTGLIMYSKYAKCDPFTTGAVSRSDQLLPYYIMDVASSIPGLSGLFIAGVFCAALSTLSASLNCMAGTVYEDFVQKWTGATSERIASNILKLIVVVIGIVCTALVFVIENLGGLLPLAISFAGVTSGPLFGMFTLGLLFPKASSKGTFYGTLISLLVCCWFIFMTQYYKAQGFITNEDKPLSTEGCVGNISTIISTIEYFNVTTTQPILYNNTVDFNNSSYLLNGTMSSTTGTEDFKPFWLFRISFYYYTPLGAIFTMICIIVLSYILRNDDPPVHKDLLSPVIHPFLPEDMHIDKNNMDYYSVNKALHLVTNNSEKCKDVSY